MTSLVPHLIGATHLHFTSLRSTNLFATELLSKTRPTHGTVVSASFQTEGRGQIGRSWVSEPGENACLSVILYPQLPATEQFQLNASVALALQAFVAASMEGQVSIKWPNDIYVGERKIAGILIQNALAGNSIRHSVVGIGLNVNQKAFSEEISNPTSLVIETGKQADIHGVIRGLCTSLDVHWKLMQQQSVEETILAYEGYLFRRDEPAQFVQLDKKNTIEGTILGVEQDGRLRLYVEGQVKTFAFNEIRMVV